MLTDRANDSHADAAPGEWETSGDITIISQNGFHARPAALFVKASKKFESDINIVRGDSSCNAKSLVSVMGLSLQRGDIISIEARGRDAREAIAALAPVISSDLEEGTDAPAAAVRAAPPDGKRGADESGVFGVFRGITASPGIAAGVIKQVRRSEIEVAEYAANLRGEIAALDGAVAEAKRQIGDIERSTRASLDVGNAAIFGAHAELLDDPDMLDQARKLISLGHSAAFAWRSAYKSQAAKLSGLANELFAARANDIEDVGRRVLKLLTGVADEIDYPENCILIARDLTPSDTAGLGKKVLGFCTVEGGATSHIAILARSLSLPALVGIDAAALDIEDGTAAILNADEGSMKLNPGPADAERVRAIQAKRAARRAMDVEDTFKPAVTTDGMTVGVAANIGGISDARHANALGCDGVGLLRSEFLFIDRASAPGEDEQAEAYIGIARAIGREKPLVIRTMDIGGDKPIPYIEQEREENPFLGVRGIRLSLEMPDLFEGQIRSILRAAEFCRLHVMFPMVSTIGEFHKAKDIVRGIQRTMGIPGGDVKLGVMIEVPSAAILARHFAREADFLSLGTNDLTQYTLAADRGNPKLSNIADGLDPSVLAMIKSTVDGAKRAKSAEGRDCWVGVCGGIAGDPMAVPVLLGMGITELSVSVPAIPGVKAMVRGLARADCERLAGAALETSCAAEVRCLIKRFLKEGGLTLDT